MPSPTTSSTSPDNTNNDSSEKDQTELDSNSKEDDEDNKSDSSSSAIVLSNPQELPSPSSSSPSPTPSSISSPLLATLSCGTLAFLTYELHTQKKLTSPPLLFYQTTPQNDEITARMGTILTNPLRPSLLVGTRPLTNSIAAYSHPGPRRRSSLKVNGTDLPIQHLREILKMPHDGAQIGIDWEIPPHISKEIILAGKISSPVLLMLHGINNHANFGYIRSLMRKCTSKGWISAGMNFRGCGGVKLTTPRGYNAAYTGDLRGVVDILSHRLSDTAPLFLIGNSLGANLVVKYMGEEGLAGTLPPCVAGGISLGNPLHIQKMSFPWGNLMGVGVRKTMHENKHEFLQMNEPTFQKAFKNALFSIKSVSHVDKISSPYMIRNELRSPYLPKIGYENEKEYWDDASSYRHLRNVNVPLLKVTAQDDFLVRKNAQGKIGYAVQNPNVIWVESRTGGHLGWFQSKGGSWADDVVVDFVESVCRMREMGRLDGDDGRVKKEWRREMEKMKAEVEKKDVMSRL